MASITITEALATMDRDQLLSALAAEMGRAEVLALFASGSAKRQALRYRPQCWQAIQALDPVEDIGGINTDALAAELEGIGS